MDSQTFNVAIGEDLEQILLVRQRPLFAIIIAASALAFHRWSGPVANH